MLDRDRVVAILFVVAGTLVLAAVPTGSNGMAIGDGAWIIVAGITFSAGWQVYSRRREADRPDPGRWGLAAAAGVLLATAAFLGAMLVLGPVVEANPTLAGNPVPIAVTAWALLTTGAVLWARGRQQRTTTLALAVSMGTILGGVSALRAGGTWTPLALIALFVGLGVFTAAVAPSYRARFGGAAAQAQRRRDAPGAQAMPGAQAIPEPPRTVAPGRAVPRSVKRRSRHR